MKEQLPTGRDYLDQDGNVRHISDYRDDGRDTPERDDEEAAEFQVAVEEHDKIIAPPQRRKIGRRAVMGPQFGEEEGVGYPDGKPHYMQSTQPISDEQAAINRRGLQLVRETLDAKKQGDNTK